MISNINLKYEKGIIESIVPNPDSVPYILKDDLINFYVTFKGQLQKPVPFHFEYLDSISKFPYKAEIIVNPSSFNQPFVDKMAHLKIIKNLEDAVKNPIKIEDEMLYAKVKDYRK